MKTLVGAAVSLGAIKCSYCLGLAALCLAVLGGVNGESGAAEGAVTELSSLDDLKNTFNADAGRPRTVVLLSPTCPMCVQGGKWIQKNVLDAHNDEDLRVYVVWEPILASDARDKIPHTLINDPRVREYWDQERITGRWFYENVKQCDTLGEIAWDAYYLFDGDAKWVDTLDPIQGCGAPIYKTTDDLTKTLDAMLDNGKRGRSE